MNKLLLLATLLLSAFITACGPPPQAGGESAGNQGAATAEGPVNTPTMIVLATPTPRPAPPTPTRRVTATTAPIESAATEEVAAEATSEGTVEATTEATTEPAATEEAAAAPEDMILIPAGPVTIGQDGGKPKNGPAHQVDVAAFEIDRFEVTNDDFARFAEAAGYQTFAEKNSNKNWKDAAADGKEFHPVVYVTWDDAKAYCEWAGKRLPTEVEWEKAARGEDGRSLPWGSDVVAENANFKQTGIRGTTAVGSFPAGASPFGVEDMAGNVSEWTSDDFVAYPGAAADADPFFGKGHKVHRGGGWFADEDDGAIFSYNRNAGPPDTSANDDIGFRCVRDAQ